MLRCTEQHGGVAIVPTRVHLAGVFGCVRKLVELLHGQCIHIGSKANGFAALVGFAFDDADYTRGAHASVNGDAPLGELASDDIGSAIFLKAKFGVGVDITADGSDLGCAARGNNKGGKKFHSFAPARLINQNVIVPPPKIAQ
jgi:hypothetical protein